MFEDQVKITRVYSLYRVKLDFMMMLKNLYNKYQVLATMSLMCLSICYYVNILTEFEMPVFNLNGVLEAVFHTIVTMTTVGYGDKSAISSVGQTSMVCAVFFGVVFEGMFLIAWAKFIKLDDNEQQAFIVLQRAKFKKEMKVYSARIFAA